MAGEIVNKPTDVLTGKTGTMTAEPTVQPTSDQAEAEKLAEHYAVLSFRLLRRSSPRNLLFYEVRLLPRFSALYYSGQRRQRRIAGLAHTFCGCPVSVAILGGCCAAVYIRYSLQTKVG